MMKLSGEGAVFSLFSVEDLAKILTGKGLGGLLRAAGVEKSTAYGVEEKQDIDLLLRVFEESGASWLKQAAQAIRLGEMKCTSSAASFFYPNLEPVWGDYAATMAMFDEYESAENWSRSRFNKVSAESICEAVLVGSNAIDAIAKTKLDEERAEFQAFISFIKDDRSALIRSKFFILMASLDIDLCGSQFKGLMPRMLLPSVMPINRRMRGGRTYAISSSRRLFDICYCLAMDCKNVPSLEHMVSFDEAAGESVRGRIGRKSLVLEDYLNWFHVWRMANKSALPPRKNKADDDRSWASFVVIYFAARILDVVFSYANANNNDALINRFYRNYYAAWKHILKKRELDELVGEAWDESDLLSYLLSSGHDTVKAASA